MHLASDLQMYEHHNKQLQTKLDEQSTDYVTISEVMLTIDTLDGHSYSILSVTSNNYVMKIVILASR